MRPRDPAVDDAIRRATLDLLGERGYDDLTIEAVARRAGVGRPTVYRRWPSKADLVHEVVFPPVDGVGPLVRDTGDLRTDLRTFVAATATYFARPEALAAVPGLMTAFHADAELRDRLAARLDAAARDDFRTLVRRAVERGALPRATDADLLFDVLVGAVLFGLLVSGRARRRGFARSVADLVAR